jgi:hypothetical protein
MKRIPVSLNVLYIVGLLLAFAKIFFGMESQWLKLNYDVITTKESSYPFQVVMP